MAKKAKFKNANKTPKWMVEDLSAKPGEAIEWDGTAFNSEFIVWFPGNRNPLEGPNEVYSRGGVAQATVKQPYGGVITKDARFRYCILLTDEAKKDVVIGEKSPPEMIIE
ncbi:MAG TPA: hypothetical protein DEP53_05025 [Bacteroidetes bacterium]|nr:hypothetical protein [Bacteroidota bacterium]